MTVEDNVRLPAPAHPGERAPWAVLRTDGAIERERAVRERAAELLEFFELDHLAEAYASELSGGQRKLLEFARALMLEPSLLLLDEPFAGVNPVLTKKLTARVSELNKAGQTFLVIEHDIGTLSALVDRLVVLSEGRVLANGAPEMVLGDDRVIDTYLGGGRS
ncbi:MAG: ATP-binding cassette domain-containing protein [Halobacteriales archaeon]